MKITLGDYEVVFSGTVITILNEPLIFHFPKPLAPLRLVATFILDETRSGSFTEYNLIDTDKLEVHFVNFGKDLGSGNTELIKLGSFQNKQLYFNYRVYAISGISNTLHYTFYSREGGNNIE